MLKDCQDLVNAYIEWLRQEIRVENINDICEITTPFLDRHNDHLQIYVKKSDGDFLLTDDGYTITDLRLSGCEFNTEKRRQMLQSILNGFGIRRVEDELVAEMKPDNFPQKKHDLLQAMLAVNDLFVMAEPTVATLFREDVERFLRIHEIRFTPSVKFTGKSGLNHSFDFVIPASQAKPERVLKTISRPNRQSISLFIFSWTEIAEVRPPTSTAYGILNDTEQSIGGELMGALKQYEIRPLPWSQRSEYVEEFTQ